MALREQKKPNKLVTESRTPDFPIEIRVRHGRHAVRTVVRLFSAGVSETLRSTGTQIVFTIQPRIEARALLQITVPRRRIENIAGPWRSCHCPLLWGIAEEPWKGTVPSRCLPYPAIRHKFLVPEVGRAVGLGYRSQCKDMHSILSWPSQYSRPMS
ncbi:hypothetical protein BJX61DRAFT_320002 [Aspergillus egyptiacus]|nr:hypothetical protein BJX61DRAFT_320002 [Aspergillus egyptiacus]